MENSALCDAVNFTRELEQAYRKIIAWQRPVEHSDSDRQSQKAPTLQRRAEARALIAENS